MFVSKPLLHSVTLLVLLAYGAACDKSPVSVPVTVDPDSISDDTSAITGSVVNAISGESIPTRTVTLDDERSVRADEEGQFAFEGPFGDNDEHELSVPGTTTRVPFVSSSSHKMAIRVPVLTSEPGPAKLDSQSLVAESNETTKSFTIGNPLDEEMGWVVEAKETWVTLISSSGELSGILAPGEEVEITAVVDQEAAALDESGGIGSIIVKSGSQSTAGSALAHGAKPTAVEYAVMLALIIIVCMQAVAAQGQNRCDYLLDTCDDGNLCTTDNCEGSQCVHRPVDDGPRCGWSATGPEACTCSAGVCETPATSCADGDPCTQDQCTADLTACMHRDITGSSCTQEFDRSVLSDCEFPVCRNSECVIETSAYCEALRDAGASVRDGGSPEDGDADASANDGGAPENPDASNEFDAGAEEIDVSGLAATIVASSAAQYEQGDRVDCYLDLSGELHCTGDGSDGALGDGTHDITSSARQVDSSASGAFSTFSVGSGHVCAIASLDGSVYCWGGNTYGQLGIEGVPSASTPQLVEGLAGASAIAAGYEHTCAVAAGEVFCWGRNHQGQLGDGSYDASSATPVLVTGIDDATSVVAGDYFACASTSLGVECWGFSASGQLGYGSQGSSRVPVAVADLPDVTITSLSAGRDHSCAVADGSVFCWGTNPYYQCGVQDALVLTAEQVVGVENATTVSAGVWSSCAIDEDGALQCWGYNGSGQLGRRTMDFASTHEPGWVDIYSVTTGVWGAKQVDTWLGSCAITAGDDLLCWGRSE